MDDERIYKELEDLVATIESIDLRGKKDVEKKTEKAIVSHRTDLTTTQKIDVCIEYARLCVKYLVFDLEATKRENGYLRKMIEEQSDD